VLIGVFNPEVAKGGIGANHSLVKMHFSIQKPARYQLECGMNEKIVFVRTSSGEDEVRSRTAHLSKDIKRALLMVDGTASVAEIMKRSSPSLRGMLEDMFAELSRGGYIQDKAKVARSGNVLTPNVRPLKKPVDEVDELDFTAAFRVPTQAVLAEEAARVQALAREDAARQAQQAKTAAEQQALVQTQLRLKAEQEAADALVRAENVRRAKEVADAALRAEQAKAQAQALARAAAQEKARLEAEVARLKEKADEQTRARSEAEKLARQVTAQAQAKLVADTARLKAEQEAFEAQMRAEAEQRETAARVKSEQEATMRAEAERRAHEVQEAARLAEQHAAKVKAEAEAHARAVAEEKVRLEAEVARLKANAEVERHAAAEAARVQAEQREAAARIKAEQEAALRAEAERRAEEVQEAARLAERHAAEVKEQAEAHARAVAEEKARLEAEVARLKANAEAEAHARSEAERQAAAAAVRIQAEQRETDARIKAGQEAALREEAERRAQEVQEAARLAERHAAQVKEQAEAHARVVAEEKAGLKAEVVKLKAEADAARALAEQETEKKIAQARVDEQTRLERIHAEFIEAARIKAEQETEKVRVEAALASQGSARETSAPDKPDVAAVRDPSQWVVRGDAAPDRRKTAPAVPGCDPRGGNNGVPIVERRTTTAAVVFFDIVGYTKQPDSRQIELKQQFSQLLTECLDPLEAGERIILDTGDGAAIGFLQHPTDALETARHFRAGLLSNKYHDSLRVRIGIHLGPVSLVKDMNGQINMLGDGINSAQRVMSFAGLDQIYVSRAYFEFVSNLSDEYDDLFRYRGAQQDKHGREHQVYELLDADADEINPTEDMPAATPSNPLAFNFDAFDAALLQTDEPSAPQARDVAGQLLEDALGLVVEEPPEPVVIQAETVVVVEKQAQAQTQPYTEEEARQLADVQAKKWMEAEQRATELAARQAALPQKIFQPVAAAPAPAEKPAARVHRKPLPLGKLAAGFGVLLLAALFIVPALLPMQGYRTGIERALSAKLQQAVHVGQLSGRILPTPRLVLSDVSIGDAKQIKAKQAGLTFAFSALWSPVKSISSLDLDGVEVGALPAAALWLQQIAGDRQYPIAHIDLTGGKFGSDGIGFSDVDGELDFDASGKFTQARLNAGAHKLAVEIHATPEQKLLLSATLRDSALPSLPNWVFEDLKVNGELSRDELRISDFDGRIMGGVLTGDVRINWRSGWRVQGSLVAKVIPLQNISKLLSGDLDGSAHFQMQAESLAKLADAAILNGVFNVNKGVIGGVDIVETARLRSRESLPGGRTHFDALNGELYYANDSYQFRQLRMNDSVVKTSGALTIDHQKITGNISADLTMRAGMGSVPLQIEGTMDSPSLHVAR
jgi:hypothetical protein